MSVTIDCGEGKHDLCIGHATKTYLFPQYDGEPFDCDCPCHPQWRCHCPGEHGRQRGDNGQCPRCGTPRPSDTLPGTGTDRTE